MTQENPPSGDSPKKATLKLLLRSRPATDVETSAGRIYLYPLRMRDMADFALNVRSMQRLMIDECANSKSPEVRRRVRELNAGAVSRHALMLHSEKAHDVSSTDALFMHVAIIGMAEFFAAAQPMILPLVPEGITAEELAERYKDFIVHLVLDGLRSRVEPWSVKAPSGA